MKEWHKKYNWFYERWWKENKDEMIPFGLEHLPPEVKASYSEEELIEGIKEMYRECIIDQCFCLKHYRETHKEEWDKEFQESLPRIYDMLAKVMWN